MKNLLAIPSNDMLPFLFGKLNGQYDTGFYDDNHYLYFKSPKSHMLLQAHVDTMRDEKAPLTLYGSKVIKAVKSILGADDRAGVYAILQILDRLKDKPLPNVLFTNGEEKGGTGMKRFCKRAKAADLSHVNLCLAFDREGVGQYVTYNHLPVEVSDYVESFGFVEEDGTFSDCQLLTSKFKIPSVNLSVGYHRQHTPMEELHMDELELTINRALDMLADPISKRFKSKGYQKIDSGWSGDRYWSGHYHDLIPDKKAAGGERLYISDEIKHCEYCGLQTNTVRYSPDEMIYLCEDCKEFIERGVRY